MRRYSYILICHSYPPVLGGSEIEAQRVSAAMIQRGHKALVLTAGGPPMPPGSSFIDSEGVPVRMFGGGVPPGLRGYAFALGVAWTLWKERRNYDVAYFLMQGLQLVTGIPVAKALAGKPVVMKFSGSSLVVGMRASFIGRLSLRFLKKWASRILVLNAGMFDECRAVDLDLSKVEWMPNPVDTAEFAPVADKAALRFRLGIGLDEEVILFVGRMGPEKRLPSLVEAFSKVAAVRPRARLALVGDGPECGEVEAAIARCGVGDRVTVAGRLPMDGVLAWMQASDAIALVSEVEGLPCVLIEGMATGLPALASDIPGNSQLIDPGVEGLLTPVGGVDEMAAAMIRLLEDPAAREAMGREARRRMVAQFSTEKVAEAYETLFGEITSSAAARPR